MSCIDPDQYHKIGYKQDIPHPPRLDTRKYWAHFHMDNRGNTTKEIIKDRKILNTFPDPEANLVRSHCTGAEVGTGVIGISQLFVRSEEN